MKRKLVVLGLAVLLLALPTMFLVPVGNASPAVVTVTHYLHHSDVGTVNTIDTQGYTFNTTQSWSASTQERHKAVAAGSYVNWTFYLYPQLQASMVHSGTPAFTVYFKANASVNDVDFISTLNKISTGGARTQLSTKNSSSQSVGTSYGSLVATHGSLSATVTSGFILEANITLSASASKLNYSMAYDTSTYKSKVALKVDDPLTVTLTSDQTSYKHREQATMTVYIADIWGGYDIASAPTISFSAPKSGMSGTTSTSNAGGAIYNNTYTWNFIPLDKAAQYGYGLGDWTSTATASDQSSNSYTSSSYTFEFQRQDPSGTNVDGEPQPLQATDQTLIFVAALAIVIIVGIGLTAKSKRGRRRR